MAKKLKESKPDHVTATAEDMTLPIASKSERQSLDEQQMSLIAKAIADPRRMALLRSIAKKTTSCADLRKGLTISASTLSHHLRELEMAGLIETDKQGRSLHATLQKKVWKSYVSALKALADSPS